MLNISLKGIFFSVQFTDFKNVNMAWNPDSDKRMLAWFPELPIISRKIQVHAQAEFYPYHPV